MPENKFGTLYIVATPIGNSSDLSVRGRRILEEADLIAAEDTRRSMVLLNKLGIRNQLISNHKFNEHGKSRYFIDLLKQGKDIAVITDAGTPCISDPGNELIRAAYENEIRVIGIPGPCAAVNALAVSGFDLTSFTFLGFFPRENADRMKLLDLMRRDSLSRTFAFYESPRRIMSLIDFLITESAVCSLLLQNDMTKVHEMCFRGSPEQVKDALLAKGNCEKGEYTLVIELAEEYRYSKTEHLVSAEAMIADAMISGMDAKTAVAHVLSDQNNSYSKNELKSAVLRLKKLFAEE
ncbi:MAG: 16S rRNA (cytidine(1402)-2'-O)-methyltransferase [Oscillospiraceae bacterium]|nr:16S rRNA (cytidine(1402)-2'-O)-methyltransferase [Oscillospiraceae bacterium]MBR0393063.1 16S rRNA (cytidine(1402)-2'-O)-methyltransferase [Oscillospiraceae bacterium]